MAIMPPYDPNDKPDPPDLDPTGRERPEPELRFVTREEAHPEDKVTFMDTLAIFGAVGCAQFLRLGIIGAAFGIIILVFWIVSHLT